MIIISLVTLRGREKTNCSSRMKVISRAHVRPRATSHAIHLRQCGHVGGTSRLKGHRRNHQARVKGEKDAAQASVLCQSPGDVFHDFLRSRQVLVLPTPVSFHQLCSEKMPPFARVHGFLRPFVFSNEGNFYPRTSRNLHVYSLADGLGCPRRSDVEAVRRKIVVSLTVFTPTSKEHLHVLS